MNDSRKILFHSEDGISLESLLTVPNKCKEGIFKCRVPYDHYIHKIEYTAYKIREIRTLQIVYDDEINYQFKYNDRICFEKLKNGISADDILIIKKGRITDTSFSNIIFYDGRKWVTPIIPLLKGTKRQELIMKGIIFERKIRVNELKKYSKARLINAMIDFEDGSDIEIKNIFL